MKVLLDIINCFSVSYITDKFHEDFTKVELVVSSKVYRGIDSDILLSRLKLISSRDTFHISVNYTEDFVLTKLEDIPCFVDSVNIELNSEDDEETPFTLEINIYKKNVNDMLSIYSLDKLSEQLNISNFKNVLQNFSGTIENKIIPHFILISDERFFYTKTIYFYHESLKDRISFDKVDRDKVLRKRISNCSFLDEKSYSFIPEDFHWHTLPREKNTTDLFKLLEFLFSVISLSNISMFNDNFLRVTFDGYKKLEENIDCTKVLDNCENLEVLNETYSRCYFGGEIADKIGIVRNLLPINVEKSILDVRPEFNVSVDSNYKIYLKENVTRYIEIKQGIVQNLTDAIQRSNDISGEFYSDLQKNLFAFLTFFVTILIFNTTSTGKLQNIFTKDISYISYALLIISVIFLVLSSIVTNRKLRRFDKNYEALKGRFKDLLDENDIKNIFQNDEEHRLNINYINRSIKEATLGWIVSIVLIFLVVYSLQIKTPTGEIKEKYQSIYVEKWIH